MLTEMLKVLMLKQQKLWKRGMLSRMYKDQTQRQSKRRRRRRERKSIKIKDQNISKCYYKVIYFDPLTYLLRWVPGKHYTIVVLKVLNPDRQLSNYVYHWL